MRGSSPDEPELSPSVASSETRETSLLIPELVLGAETEVSDPVLFTGDNSAEVPKTKSLAGANKAFGWRAWGRTTGVGMRPRNPSQSSPVGGVQDVSSAPIVGAVVGAGGAMLLTQRSSRNWEEAPAGGDQSRKPGDGAW